MPGVQAVPQIRALLLLPSASSQISAGRCRYRGRYGACPYPQGRHTWGRSRAQCLGLCIPACLASTLVSLLALRDTVVALACESGCQKDLEEVVVGNLALPYPLRLTSWNPVTIPCAFIFSRHGHSLLTGLPSTTGIEEPSYVLRDIGKQNHLSEEAQLHLDRKALCFLSHSRTLAVLPLPLGSSGKKGGTGPNAEPVLNEQMASSSALRPPSTHTSPMSVWSSYLPRTLALHSALASEVDRRTKASESFLLYQLYGGRC